MKRKPRPIFVRCSYCDQRVGVREGGGLKRHTYRFYYWEKPRICQGYTMSRTIAATKARLRAEGRI